MQRLFLLSLLIATCYGASISVCGPNCDGCQEVASLDVNNCKDYSREGAATGSIKLTSCSEEDGVGKFEVFTTKNCEGTISVPVSTDDKCKQIGWKVECPAGNLEASFSLLLIAGLVSLVFN